MLRLPRRVVLTGLAAGIPAAAGAAAPAADLAGIVLIPSAERPVASLVDAEAGRVLGELPLGLVPRQALVSRPEAQLIVSDGHSPAFVLIDLDDKAPVQVPVPHPAERLTLGAGGWVLAVVDAAGGGITLFDLRRRTVMGTVAGLPRLRDVMFLDNDGCLLVAAEGWNDAALIDVNTREVVRRIGPFRGTGVLGFTRTPNGRTVLVRLQGAAPPVVLDVESKEIVGALGHEAADGVVPSGTGAFLFVTSSQGAALRVFRPGQATAAASLSAVAGMDGIYSAWLDSVAFVPVSGRRQVLVYDLDRLRPAGRLDLPGVPGQGGVTADSGRLFLPLTAPAGLAVVDARSRTLAAVLSLPSAPLAAVVPGGWGLCH